MKCLVIRLSSIGDIVLTTPVVRCLKLQCPEAEVHYLTRKAYAPLLAANPYIDKLHTVSGSLREVLPALQQEQFDRVIDLHHNIRSWRIKRALRVPSFSFPKLNIEKWLFTAFKIDHLPDTHIVDRYLSTLHSLGVTNDGRGLDYFIPSGEMIHDKDLPLSHQAGYIAIVIGAALPTKQLPEDKIAQLCTGVQYPVILMGGPSERNKGEAIASLDPGKIYNACGKFSLNESADLLRRSRLVVTPDTGMMHIAAALQKPILSIWGNTVPKLGMYPYYGQNGSMAQEDRFEVNGLSCRPCSKIGYQKCPRGHFNCMQQQDIPSIIRQIHLRLGKNVGE
jgi:ADP-heptose:LPS heptosyltransferase